LITLAIQQNAILNFIKTLAVGKISLKSFCNWPTSLSGLRFQTNDPIRDALPIYNRQLMDLIIYSSVQRYLIYFYYFSANHFDQSQTV